MIDVDTDFSGFWRVLSAVAAVLIFFTDPSPVAVILCLGLLYYINEDHQHYLKAKAYKRLGGHLGKAVKD